jgi:hypothetical protein
MEERLKYLLSLNSDWVKFAEAKNAGLLVATSGLVLMLLDHYPGKTFPTTVQACFWVGGVSLIVSSSICLISFIPHLTVPGMGRTEVPQTTDNLMFFGDIAKYSAPEFLDALYKAEGSSPSVNKIQSDLAAQVIANACISLKKFRYYTLAAWLTAVGILALAVGAVQMLAN